MSYQDAGFGVSLAEIGQDDMRSCPPPLPQARYHQDKGDEHILSNRDPARETADAFK